MNYQCCYSTLFILITVTINIVEAGYHVFRVESPQGSLKIATIEEAAKLCATRGGILAENWRVRDEIILRHFPYCQPCGWCDKGRNYRTRCGNETDGHFPCPDTPDAAGLAGYDAYCWGDTNPDLPPGAVAVNVHGNRGYVYMIRQGDLTVIPTQSLATTACEKTGGTLATPTQVNLAWSNGFSDCGCAWMVNYQAMPMNEKMKSCGDKITIMPCHFGEMSFALCWMDASLKPVGPGAVDFDNLKLYQYPDGVEPGAFKIKGGYIYPTMSVRGSKRTPSLIWATETCTGNRATVATNKQLKEAMERGMTACQCGWVALDENLSIGSLLGISLGFLSSSRSTQNEVPKSATGLNQVGQVMYPNRYKGGICGQTTGLIQCPEKNPDGDGWDVFCFKACDRHGSCPPEIAWNIPPRSVKIRGGRVYFVEHRDGRGMLTTLWFANRECGRVYPGGVTATKAQLDEAMRNGLTKCRCGMLSDGSAFMPMYKMISSCGNAHGLLPCPGNYVDAPDKGPGWDAWCFISDEAMAAKPESYF